LGDLLFAVTVECQARAITIARSPIALRSTRVLHKVWGRATKGELRAHVQYTFR